MNQDLITIVLTREQYDEIVYCVNAINNNRLRSRQNRQEKSTGRPVGRPRKQPPSVPNLFPNTPDLKLNIVPLSHINQFPIAVNAAQASFSVPNTPT